MFKRILPQSTCFYDFFDDHIEHTILACEALLELSQQGSDRPVLIRRIKDLEHATDDITHNCIEALHKTFITPLDRSDIHRLIKRMDDIVDLVDSGVGRIGLYELVEMRSEVEEMATLLVRSTREIRAALKEMRVAVNSPKIQERCIAIYQCENEADTILRNALIRLFKDAKDDPVLIIKWKEIYETFESATDRCEDVANILQGVMIEAS
ncbi:DUF47 domain-containing protein [candidate division BRC1 bacterium HGW-BRC1-1]|jgi:hypothetical protein|nr:MAG: DUF47 domain-containing protein [candidate division BRC1 bacterium HGW-BRC1-1]